MGAGFHAGADKMQKESRPPERKPPPHATGGEIVTRACIAGLAPSHRAL